MPRIRTIVIAVLAGGLWLMPNPSPAADNNGQPGKAPAQAASESATRQPEAKAAAAKPPAAKAHKPVDPNRRWIMKQTDHTGKRIKPRKPIALKWSGTAQQKQCRAYGQSLATSFDKARFYSVQGDRCKTAQYGRDFLNLVETCRKACPDRFLAANGITPLMVRNMQQLETLGRESCLGTQPAAARKSSKSHTLPAKNKPAKADTRVR